ncbi:bestrophin family protein [Skeletonema marinoi]|uniref:Bestrophin family protein n=1 Tax=Skeletonema marinoi TaxID=267567 RepID=A0AAD9DAF4_9STRA|nr:bestrophin family protein [Skeletonema marinoi]
MTGNNNSVDDDTMIQPGLGLHRRPTQQDNLRTSLRHGHGISLVHVNPMIAGHNASLITPDASDTSHYSFSSALIYQASTKEDEIFRKHVSSFSYRVICNGPFLFAIASYIAVTAIILNVPVLRESTFMDWLSKSDSGMAFFSAWEGRCLWGTLIFAAINLAQQGQGSFTEKENFRRLCALIVCFSIACKNQLYGQSIEADGDYLLTRGLISKTEYEQVIKRQGWQPYYFLGALREIIDVDLKMSGQRAKINNDVYSFKGSTTDAQLLMMDGALGQMASIIGDLIRVKATGLPMGYDSIFYFIYLVYFVVTTLSWAIKLQWYTPILMSLLHLVVRCITELGTCLEDPFGNDITDLPLDKFCRAIEAQIAAVFTDTFPESTEYVSAWPTRRATASNSTTTRPTTCLSVEEPVTPTDDDFEENYPQDKPTRQLSTILSGDALSGDDEV